MKRLIELQQRLKSNKNKKGYGFQYRDAESILEDAKPILKELGCALITTTNLEEHLGHIYYNCIVYLCGEDGKEIARASAQVRDPIEMVKGSNRMEAQQVSGSNITYAKRYALQNLLSIDNGEDDPDAINKVTREKEENYQNLQIEAAKLYLSTNVSASEYYCSHYKVEDASKLDNAKLLGIYQHLLKNKKIEEVK